ncbi:MAG: hypothetical protein OHK0017_04800 [Patescibacteria group bacterium]
MSIKATNVIGLKVISTKTGTEIETVNDVIYDPATNKVMAILVDNGGWFSDAKVILTSDIQSIGSDAVIVGSADVIKRAAEIPQRIANIARGGNYLTKTHVVTETGVKLGDVTDVFFEMPSGQVTELEVSEGAIANIASGKKTVRIQDIVTVGEDAIIVRAYTEQAFQEQGQNKGVQGAVAAGASTTGSVLSQAGEKAKELVNQAGEKLSEAKENIANHPQVQKVSQDFKSGKMEEGLRQNLQGAKQAATSAWEQGKQGVQSTTQQAQDNIQDRRLKDALGQYLTVNLPLGEVLVPINTVVTQPLIDEAQKYDLLDKLLSNVSKQPV